MRIFGDALIIKFNDAPKFDQRSVGPCKDWEFIV